MIAVGVVCGLGVGPASGGREHNEDNFLVARAGEVQMRHAIQAGPESDGILVAVADGMGGIAGGEVASRAAVEALVSLIKPERAGSARRLLVQLRDLHRDVRAAMTQSPLPGTTLTMLRSTGNRAVWGNVGDSRIYRLRMGRIEQLSRDHTRNEFHRRDGTPILPNGERLCQAFILGSRGLGFDSMIRLEPSFDADQIELRTGDVFLLCSDGVHGWLSPDRIRSVLANAPTAQDAAQAVHDAAIACGSTDNITALVVRIEGMLPITAASLDDINADTISF